MNANPLKNSFGPVASITYGNGRVLTRSYDKDYVVAGVSDPSTGGLDLAYGRDVLGNLTQIANTAGTSGNTFVYDALDRLTNVNTLTNALVAAYTYDGTGNRKSKQTTSGTQAYTYPLTSHQLLDVGGTARTYDAAGNTATIGVTAKGFVYDDTGRMKEYDASGTLAKSYSVNGLGERVRKYRGSVTAENQYTTYDTSGHVLGDYDNSANRIREIAWLDDLPVGVFDAAGNVAYIEPDHLGTPRVLIDATRNVAIWKWPLLDDAFGESAPNQDPDGDATNYVFNLRFPGQVWDGESGLSYNYFRDYDSATARFSESDPIGLLGGLSTFAYSISSPISSHDRFGLCWSNAWASIHSLTGGGDVTLDEIGCTSDILSQVQPERNLWKSVVAIAARTAATSMACGTSSSFHPKDAVKGMASSIFWIRGYNLKQTASCELNTYCGDNCSGTQNTFTYSCTLSTRYHDRYKKPLDHRDHSHGHAPAEHWWQDVQVPIYDITQEWSDAVSGNGTY